MAIFTLYNSEEFILNEIANKKLKQKDIAQTYALLIRSGEGIDWRTINEAIVNRWSMSGLKRIKEMAHNGKCFED